MAKAIICFHGKDSYGRSVMAAKREDGKWFTRSYGFNGYGNGWLSWRAEREPMDHLIREDGDLEWGFKTIYPTDPKGLRLPNPKE